MTRYATCLLYLTLLATPATAQDEDWDALFGDPVTEETEAGDRESAPDDAVSEPAAAAQAEEPPRQVITLPTEEPPRVTPRANARVVEEIVVTAQKTEQGLRDVPISVSAIGGEQVAESAITDPGELVQYTPNVKFSSGWAAVTSITIRGFGSPPFARGIEPSVGLVIDDVFYGRSTFTADGIFDLERLEVLRGPQGTLFGKNTVAGLLNFTTAEPLMEEMVQSLTGGISNDDGLRVEGAISMPFIPGELAGRLSLRARRQDAGIYNSTRDEQLDSRDLAGRFKLRWLLNDQLTAELVMFAADAETSGIAMQLQDATDRALSVSREYDPATEDDAFDGNVSTNAESFSARDTRSISLKLSADFDRLWFFDQPTVTGIINHATVEGPFLFDTDYLPIPFNSLATDGPERYRQQTLELRFLGNTPGLFGFGSSMDWIGGLFYFGSEFKVSQFAIQRRSALVDFVRAGGAGLVPAGAPDAAISNALTGLGLPVGLVNQLIAGVAGPADEELVVNVVDSESESYAAFLQTTWFLSDRLSAVLGLRLGLEEKSAFQSSQANGVLGPIFAGQRNFENTGQRRETEFTPKIALSYDLADEITLFGNVTQGFKSGGFSGPLVAPTNLEFEPETALSSELGVKSRLLGGSLALNATVFGVKFDDLQLNLFDGVNVATINAAAATAYGMELDFQWLPRLEFLSLAGSLGYTNVSYDSFPCGPAQVGQEGHEVEACGESDGPAFPPDRRAIQPGATQDLSGDPLPFVPRLTGSFTPTVRLPLIPTRGIGALIGIDVIYQGEQWLDADLDPQAFQAATTKLNARLGMAHVDGRWSLVLNAKNLTGEKERAFLLDANQLPNNYATIPTANDPTWSLDLRYTFAE